VLFLSQCLELKNLQASATIALQEKNYGLAIRQHLLALSESVDEEGDHSATVGEDMSEADAAAELVPAGRGPENGADAHEPVMHAFAVQGGNEEMSEGTGSSSTSSGSRSLADDSSSPKHVTANHSSWLASQALRIAEAFFTLVELNKEAISSVLAEVRSTLHVRNHLRRTYETNLFMMALNLPKIFHGVLIEVLSI